MKEKIAHSCWLEVGWNCHILSFEGPYVQGDTVCRSICTSTGLVSWDQKVKTTPLEKFPTPFLKEREHFCKYLCVCVNKQTISSTRIDDFLRALEKRTEVLRSDADAQ